jgi:hypothetical protein
MIEIIERLVTDEELNYINNLIQNKLEWEWSTFYDEVNAHGEKLFFDSIHIDYSKLKNYHEIITANGEYEIIETGVVMINPNRQLINSKHTDFGDVSYVTYLNDEYEGGKFFYYNDDNEEFSIEPYPGLSLKINYKTKHRVGPVTSGVRYSLYSFLQKLQ